MRTFTCNYFLGKVAVSTAMLIGLLTCASQPAHAQSCTYWVAPAPTGSDANPGTSAAPWQTVQKAFNTASAGQTVCFYGGTYPENPNLQCNTDPDGTKHCYSQIENNSGSAGSPITFTNVSGQVALIQGSTEIHGSYITFQGTPNTTRNCSHADTCGLIFVGNQDTGTPTTNVGICCAGATNPQFVKFDHVEIRNGVYHAGLYEEGCNNTVTGSYVHDNGVSATDSNHTVDNGIYWSSLSAGCTNGGLIANNIVEHNWSKGIQLYCGDTCTSVQHVTVEENTVVNNDAQGIVVWGGNNSVVNNILYNNNNHGSGGAGGAQGDLRVSDSTNVIDHNITYDTTANACPDWYYARGSTGHQCDPQTIQAPMITNVLHSDPLFVSPGSMNGDWHLMGTSPAIGFSNQSYVQTLDHDGNVRTNPTDAGCYD